MYFKAIEKIGEQALQSSTSHMLGKALLHIFFCPVVSHSYIFLTLMFFSWSISRYWGKKDSSSK